MSQSNDKNFTHPLRELMQRVGISSFKALSRQAGVSERQVKRLRLGALTQMRVYTLIKISLALQVSLTELVATFGDMKLAQEPDFETALQQEYQLLLVQHRQQRESLIEDFQQSSLQVLESWLLQWPTAAYAAQQNPQLPAVRVLPLVRPVEQLLQQWGVVVLAAVGEELPYDPQWHQLMEGTAQPGELVRVRYTGYRQGDKLLHRAKVSPIANFNNP